MPEASKPTTINLESMLETHWPVVQAIYAEGIATGNATFETEAPDWAAWNANHLQECRLVATRDQEVVGWAALSPVSRRPVYAGVAEVSVYVSARSQGQGVGKTLLNALVEASEAAGIWTLQASIFPENRASISIHKSCGFREVGLRERIARQYGIWRDTVILERRSSVTGD
ncbi:MAG: GNAT family N-acetyltransferase [Dehalococcoidia bacterium]